MRSSPYMPGNDGSFGTALARSTLSASAKRTRPERFSRATSPVGSGVRTTRVVVP